MSEDRYDRAVDYLTEHPSLIEVAWDHGHVQDVEKLCLSEDAKEAHRQAGCLFGLCCSRFRAGCLTQVCHNGLDAGTPELTAEIRADERIPFNGKDIEVDDLPMFAEWQRRIDKELAEVAQ